MNIHDSALARMDAHMDSGTGKDMYIHEKCIGMYFAIHIHNHMVISNTYSFTNLGDT